MIGTGTQLDPYIIETPQDLDDVRLDANENVFYKLNNDIDLSGYASWVPICSGSDGEFEGRLDGNGFAIKNMTITGSIQNAFGSYVGLFSQINISSFLTSTGSYSVKDLTIESFSINLNNYEIGNYLDDGRRSLYVGALAGAWWDFTFPASKEDWNAIQNVKIKNGTINIIKSNLEALVTESVSTLNIGGIIGYIAYGLITSCSVDDVHISGIVSSSSPDTSFVSGLGNNLNQATYNCVKNSTIQFEYKIGSPAYTTDYTNLFISAFSNINVVAEVYDNYVYNTVVSGALNISGFMNDIYVDEDALGDSGHDFPSGRTYTNATFGNTPETSVYPFTMNYAEYTNSSSLYNYIESKSDIYTTNPITPVGMPVITELTEVQMKNSASYVNWDFDSVWTQSNNTQDGYPYFGWEALEPDVSQSYDILTILTPNGGEIYSGSQIIPITWEVTQSYTLVIQGFTP